MVAPTNVAESLDTEIKKLEQRVQEIESLAQQLPALKARLEAYREIRALMLSPSTDNSAGSDGPSRRSRVDPNSIGSLAIGILKEFNGALHVDELLTKVRAKGKPTLTKATLSSTLYTYVKAGRMKLTGPNTFALP